jgi:hypothetical protein
MAHIDHNSSFVRWVFSPQENFQAHILTITQKQGIQNFIAFCAEQKLNLEYDATNHLKSLQESAELSGRIAALKSLLDYSDEMEKLMNPTNNSSDNPV